MYITCNFVIQNMFIVYTDIMRICIPTPLFSVITGAIVVGICQFDSCSYYGNPGIETMWLFMYVSSGQMLEKWV